MLAPALIESELLARREKLEAARTGLPQSEQLSRLLFEVDSALARVKAGTFGICEVCHDTIEEERLAADPLIRTCLDHMSGVERRALEQDLDLASRVQQTLLPPRPLVFNGWHAWYEYLPLRAASGDYCDLIPGDDGELLFLVGDVAGKGIAASVLMAHLHAIFRSLVSLQLPFADLVVRANRIFCESTGGLHYATLVCGRASADGRIELSNAGHCLPLHLQAARTNAIASTGLPVGLFCMSPYTADTLMLARGETLLLYTDGVTDTENAAGSYYGADRLAEVAARYAADTPAALVTACAADLNAFRGSAARSDDVTILALRRG